MRFDSSVPSSRVRVLNDRPIHPAGDFVVYWMIAARRVRWNFGLDRAVEWARQLKKPLVILEALRCDYPHASDRLHQFVLDGMAANRKATARSRALYYPYVERTRGEGRELLRTLAAHACLVITDWSPAFFLPRMIETAAKKIDVSLEAVDSNGLIPLAAHERAFTTARSYRAFMQRVLREHVTVIPDAAPLTRLPRTPRITTLPTDITGRWPAATDRLLTNGKDALAALPIDHGVAPAAIRGGSDVASKTLRAFIATKLARYGDARNDPDADATSRLSPYLHFGHISAHEIFAAVMTRERWTTRKLAKKGGGAREGWWGVSASAETFLDQLVVWRELAFNGCEYVPSYDDYSSLPAWSRATLEAHLADERPHLYPLEQLDAAATSDEVWNAAQRQLVTEGWFSGYLRMLWGKKLLEWSAHPADALARMQALMDRYSLDGRDPNAYASYAWVLGRYDRPWPERPIFGTVRYMSSASTTRKLKMKRFLSQYATHT
jgi:deoxyribodipyrimidine photo-lyase